MRKAPRQARSRALVADLVEAAALEIAESGLLNLTTNRVAARAGISVGSLYQYFADKDELIEAVSQAAAERLLAALTARMRGFGQQDMRATTRQVLTTVFDILEADPLHRELSRHADLARPAAGFATLESFMTEALRVYLLRHHRNYPVADLPAALFVMVNSVHYTMARYLRGPAPGISRQALIAGLTDMLAAYMEAARVEGL
jgi:AcrR family transcriptional regulator